MEELETKKYAGIDLGRTSVQFSIYREGQEEMTEESFLLSEEEQKEYMLREKIKLIKEELGEVDLKDADIDKIRNKMNSLDLPESIIKRLNEEIDRYSLTSSASPEVTTIRTYIDWLLCLPWNKLS